MFFFPKANKLGRYLVMINRASMAMWGNARKSTGPPKWPEKKRSPGMIAGDYCQIRRHGSDFIYTKNSARPRSDFLYTKNAPPPSADFLYTHSFGAFVRFCKWKKASIYWKNFPAARAKWSNLNKFDTNEIFPLRGLKRYEILEEKGICIQLLNPSIPKAKRYEMFLSV